MPAHEPGPHRPGVGGRAQTENSIKSYARPHVAHRHLAALCRPWIGCNASISRPGLTAPTPGRAHHRASARMGVAAHTSPIRAPLLAPHAHTELTAHRQQQGAVDMHRLLAGGRPAGKLPLNNPRSLLSHSMLPSSHKPTQVGACRAPTRVRPHPNRPLQAATLAQQSSARQGRIRRASTPHSVPCESIDSASASSSSRAWLCEPPFSCSACQAAPSRHTLDRAVAQQLLQHATLPPQQAGK